MKHISLVYLFSHSYSRSLWNRYAEGAPHVNNNKIIVRHRLEEIVEDEYEGVKLKQEMLMLSKEPTHQENMYMKCTLRDYHMDILVIPRSIKPRLHYQAQEL